MTPEAPKEAKESTVYVTLPRLAAQLGLPQTYLRSLADGGGNLARRIREPMPESMHVEAFARALSMKGA